MRTDVATILAGMGHVSDRDFVAFQIAPGNCDFTWLAGTTRPTEADIEAAGPQDQSRGGAVARSGAARRRPQSFWSVWSAVS